MRFRISLALSLFFLLPGLVSAQLTPETALQQLSQDISVTINPENPGPNTDVTIGIESYSTDLNAARITWTIGGKVMKDGLGQKVFGLKTGTLGTAMVISLSIQPSDGGAFQKTITIAPASVDLLWQANSYVPPFYKSRALFARQNSITFVAIPNMVGQSGKTVSPQNAIYTWSRDGNVLGNLSGTGKNSLTLVDSILGLPMNVSVVATTLDKSLVAKNSILIQSGSPLVLFYENNPLYGILYNRELGDSFSLSSPEMSVAGAPYYFSNNDRNSGTLKYTWSLNGSPITSPNQSSITIRGQQGVAGNSTLGLTIENPNNLLQKSEGETTVQFGNPGNQNNL